MQTRENESLGMRFEQKMTRHRSARKFENVETKNASEKTIESKRMHGALERGCLKSRWKFNT